MTKKALLVVDVQNDFCPGGALAVTNGDQVVEPLNRMINHAFGSGWKVYASRDWHPAVTKHFKIYGGFWPVHCVQNTPGADFHPRLNSHYALVISKAFRPDEDGYSEFEGVTPSGIPLDEALKSASVTDLYVGGLATDYCVKATCLDGVKLGYKVYLLLDACRAVNVNPSDGDKAVEEMKAAGVLVTTTEEVINADLGC